MAQPTQAYKRSLSGSVGAGLSSVFSRGGRSYYILEHKVSSKYHKAGEAQEIIVDQIELGRDPKCQVQFDESFATVSRRHAAIVRDGDNWKLVQLSHTNTTFLNGRPIEKEWYLQNGDEIQLSVNGPKLGFIVPTGNQSKTGSIGLSRRLSLFRQQALKPYKTAMTIMAVALVLLIVGGITWGVMDNKHDIELAQLTQAQIETANARADSLRSVTEQQQQDMEEKMKHMQRQNASLQQQLEGLKSNAGEASDKAPKVSASSTTNKSVADCEPSVYYVIGRKIVASFNGETKTIDGPLFSGTGFLLDDGRFVTARHVAEPWMFPSKDDEQMLALNAIAHSGGKVVCYLEAYSPTGRKMFFTSEEAKVNRSSDREYTEDGLIWRFAQLDATDFAYFRTSEKGGLAYNNSLSSTLPVQAKLTILGYPLGLGANNDNDIHPLYSEATVAKAGLDNGAILTTATTFEHGNSGGPVFATTTEGNMVVVGIVSAGAGRSTGFIVPISAVH